MRWLSLLLLLGGCLKEREPGPHDSDEGKVTYWLVTDSDSTVEQCTDAEDWAEALEAPEFGDNSYFMYRVESGGKTATSMDCDTLDPSSCSEGDMEFTIDGHTLTYTAPPEVVATEVDCDVALDAVWTFVDNGEDGDFTLGITFSYDGDSCDAVETAVIAEGTNGYGLADCEIAVEVGLEMAQVL